MLKLTEMIDLENGKNSARQAPERDIYGVKVDKLSASDHLKFDKTSQIYRFWRAEYGKHKIFSRQSIRNELKTVKYWGHVGMS